MFRLMALVAGVVFIAGMFWFQHDENENLSEQLAKSNERLGACAASVAPLRAAADRAKVLQVENDAARAAAATTAKALNIRADKQLATAGSTPGDTCKSAADRANAWLVERGK